MNARVIATMMMTAAKDYYAGIETVVISIYRLGAGAMRTVIPPITATIRTDDWWLSIKKMSLRIASVSANVRGIAAPIMIVREI